MLFKRRARATRRERFRTWLWPRVSWRRSLHYYTKRVLRLSGTPYAIAVGTAAGAGAAFTPFLGLHLIIAFALAWVLRGNLIAGAIGTFVGNPLTYPFIWGATYEIVRFLLHGAGGGPSQEIAPYLRHGSLDQIWPFLQPMLVRSIALGLAAGCIIYPLVYKAVSAYQDGRRERFAGRRQAGSTTE